jgi:hypothetical protein
VAGCCECGDEPSGSGATELVRIRLSNQKHRYSYVNIHVRFQVLTAASMMFRIVFWDVLPCKMIVDRRFRGA